MAANQINIPFTFGYPAPNPTAPAVAAFGVGGSLGVNWLAYSFTSQQAKTLTDVWVFQSILNGTPAAADLSCAVQTDSSGSPSGSSATGGGFVTNSVAPAAGVWLHWTFTAVTITAATQFWLVFKNTNANANNNFPSYQWMTNVLSPAWNTVQTTSLYNYSKKQSTNSGSAWTSAVSGIGGFRIGYNDGTYDGLPVSAVGTTSTGSKVFNDGTSSNEAGIKFTSPANATCKLATVSCVPQISAGVGPIKIRVYEGSSTSTCTLKAESETLPAGNVSNNAPLSFHFSSDVTLSPSTVYRVVLADASSTGSSIKYFTNLELTIDSNTPSSLLPCDGTMVKTTTTAGATALNGTPTTAFTDAAIGTLMMTGLALDTNGEFTGGGGAGLSRVFTGF